MSSSSDSRRLDLLGFFGVLACCALWGGNPIAVKFSVPEIPAFGCAGLRFVLSLPVVLLVCYFSRQPWFVPRQFWGLLAINALFTVAQIGTFNYGTSLSQAGRASVFINVHPLVVAPLSWLLLGERSGWRGLMGLLGAAIGIAILLSSRWQGFDSGLMGDLIVLMSGLIFGVQTIVQKRTFRSIPPATLLLNQAILAIPLFLLYSGLTEGFANYQFTPAAVWGLLYQGLAVSGVCFSLWLLLLRKYMASQLATMAFLTPLFGVAFGTTMLGEELRWQLLVGGLLVGLGIYLVATDRPLPLKPRPSHAAPEPNPEPSPLPPDGSHPSSPP